jgi:hypothetical protein
MGPRTKIVVDIGMTGKKAVASIWFGLWWDEVRKRLYHRRIWYWTSPADPFTVMMNDLWIDAVSQPDGEAAVASLRNRKSIQRNESPTAKAQRILTRQRWTLVRDRQVVVEWSRSFLRKFPNKDECTREFLRTVNVRTHEQLEQRLKRLSRWEEEDKAKLSGVMAELRPLPMKTIAQLNGSEPFWTRSAERVLLKKVQADIEKLLLQWGYDPAEVLGGEESSQRAAPGSGLSSPTVPLRPTDLQSGGGGDKWSRLSRTDRVALYNEYYPFFDSQRQTYYKRLMGTKYGATKHAIGETLKEIKRKKHVAVPSKALKEAMERRTPIGGRKPGTTPEIPS